MADRSKGSSQDSPEKAEKVDEPQKVAADAVKETEPASDARTYEVERLVGRDAYALTGYEGHVVAGALSGVNRKNLTVEEAKAAVAAWLSAPLKEA